MRRAILLLVGAGLLGAGCGSSSSAQKAATTTARGTTATAGTGTGTATGSTARPGSKLSFGTKPHYASPSASTPLQRGLVRITYRDFTVDPEVVRVRAPATIEWHSEGPGRDNVTSQSGPQRFASADFGQGGSFRVHLSRPGIYHYISTLHAATINGTIEVVG
jgi:plastocyanin